MADMDEDGDDLLFAGESDEAEHPEPAAAMDDAWKILIVDDDPEVHAITRVVMGDVTFEDRSLLFLSAYSASEAQDLLQEHDDIAVVLLDVVMETDDAGLTLVHFIRHKLENRQVRIILRTGQPGQAPERQVIVSYDINDYKAKSELTAQKLFTTTIAALRSFRHIFMIEQSRRGLEKIIAASSSLFEQRSLQEFIQGVAIQIGSLFRQADGSILCSMHDDNTEDLDRAMTVVAGTGPFESATGSPVVTCVPPPVYADIRHALTAHCNVYREHHCVVVFESRSHAASVVCLFGHAPLSEIDRRLLEIFCSKVAIGFDNLHLYEQLLNAHKATVYALGKMAEFKDEATGDHVRRIERLSERIAIKLRNQGYYRDELSDEFIAYVGLASILHDVGKVGIPDAILRKPGRLDPDEMTVMREHAAIGGTILREAARLVHGRSYLSLGAEIAEGHHEKFDGSGYPKGIVGTNIPLAGRIVAVADVFDALLHKRPYKEAWERQVVLDHMRKEAGSHFDPVVVEALFAVLQEQDEESSLS